jgi:ribosome-associated toxin RatA of RatAB toxin-antitoxin module
VSKILGELCPWLVREVRGRGLLVGLDFTEASVAAEFLMAMLEQHVVLSYSLNTHSVVRLTPPATLDEDDLAWLSSAVRRSAADLARRHPRAASGPRATSSRQPSEHTMRIVTLTVLVADRNHHEAFASIADFAAYPQHSNAVRSVVVTETGPSTQHSRWEVAFRNGLLRWTEEDTVSSAGGTITFRQVEGDVDQFEGGWEVEPTDGGARVRFTARVDMGIPTLADVLEPIASRTLLDNTWAILHGMFGPAAQLVGESDDAAVPDAPGSLATFDTGVPADGSPAPAGLS